MSSFTIPLTTKQRAAIEAVEAQKVAIQNQINSYITAIVDGFHGTPEKVNGVKLTPDGIELDVPDSAPAAEASAA